MSKSDAANSASISQLYEQALSAHHQGQLTAAKALYLLLIKQKPHHFDALHHLCMIAMHEQQLEQALQWINLALAQNPQHAVAHANRGIVLYYLKQYSQAVSSYERAIRLNPQYAQAYCNRGIALRQLGRLEEAERSYDKAIALQADYAEAYANRGNVRLKLQQFDLALEDQQRAVRLRPKQANYLCNRGTVLHALQQFSPALKDFNLAIQLQADHAGAYLNRAMLQLLQGQWDNAWQDYEWRLRLPELAWQLRDIPRWRGVQSLQGKNVLLHAEQGLGDTLQFCRYCTLLAELGAQVYLWVQATLLPLLNQLPQLRAIGALSIVSQHTPDLPSDWPAMDYQVSLLSLPLIFKTDLSSVPFARGYLTADPGRLQAWQQRLPTAAAKRIGLVWRGSPTHENDRQRSISLQVLCSDLIRGLADCDIAWISLQIDHSRQEQALLRQYQIQEVSEHLTDFAETAALCAGLDAVITVDSAVAHLAGALSRPTYLLLAYTPDWRWLLQRADTPWYRSVQLYRQDDQRNWSSVLARLRADLSRLF